MEFNSIPLFHDFFSKFSSHPLFSTIVALYTLIILYAPSFFLRITLSPVVNSTGIILVFLLRLGADERSKTETSNQESGILDYEVDKRLKKEYSSYLESRVLDRKDKWLPVNQALESSYKESKFLDSVEQSQTHVEFEPKIGLGHESDHKNGLGHVVSYQARLESEPGSGLKMECNQSNIEFQHDLCMESRSQDDHHKWESLETNFMESSQVTKEEKPTMETDTNQVDVTMKILDQWNMRTPLEIIYEGEEEDYAEKSNAKIGCEKYPSLSTESETNSSSDGDGDGDFSMKENWESVLFKWEEEEREELIEISLDRHGKTSIEEEDNLIEIDIFPKIY